MPAIDRSTFASSGMQTPAATAAAITPSDTEDDNLPAFTRSIYIGGAGNLKVLMAGEPVESDGGSLVTFTNLLAGQVYPFRVAQVFTTDTTCTGIVALY